MCKQFLLSGQFFASPRHSFKRLVTPMALTSNEASCTGRVCTHPRAIAAKNMMSSKRGWSFLFCFHVSWFCDMCVCVCVHVHVCVCECVLVQVNSVQDLRLGSKMYGASNSGWVFGPHMHAFWVCNCSTYYKEYITPQSVQRLIQLCKGFSSSIIGSLRHNTVNIWGKLGESRVLSVQKQRCPALRPAVRWCGVYAWHQKTWLRSNKTLCRAGSGVAHSGGYVLLMPWLSWAGTWTHVAVLLYQSLCDVMHCSIESRYDLMHCCIYQAMM